jgi:hypothetical protein
MMSFWKLGTSSTVVEKNGQPKTSNLKDSVDKPSSDQLDADSSTHDGADKKTQVSTEEQASQGTAEKKSSATEECDELDAPAVTTSTIEKPKANSDVHVQQKPEEPETERKGLFFWNMGSSTAVVEKNGEPITPDLKGSVDKPSNDQLDAESSIFDGNNNKAQVVTEEQLSQGVIGVDKDTDINEEHVKDVFQSLSSLNMYPCTTIDLLFISFILY